MQLASHGSFRNAEVQDYRCDPQMAEGGGYRVTATVCGWPIRGCFNVYQPTVTAWVANQLRASAAKKADVDF